jgi:hypothetical protein
MIHARMCRTNSALNSSASCYNAKIAKLLMECFRLLEQGNTEAVAKLIGPPSSAAAQSQKIKAPEVDIEMEVDQPAEPSAQSAQPSVQPAPEVSDEVQEPVEDDGWRTVSRKGKGKRK